MNANTDGAAEDNRIQVKLYTTPSCGGCAFNKAALSAEPGIDLEVIDLSQDPEALNMVRTELGHLQAPIITVLDSTGRIVEHWSKTDPERIDRLRDQARRHEPPGGPRHA